MTYDLVFLPQGIVETENYNKYRCCVFQIWISFYLQFYNHAQNLGSRTKNGSECGTPQYEQSLVRAREE